MLALVVEGLPARPGLLDDPDVLAGPVVALVLRQEVALALLFVVVAARDEVHGEPAVAELVEGREGLGGERRVRHVGPVGEQDLEPVELRDDVRGGGCRVRCAGRVGEQDAVPVVVLVGAGQAQRVVAVEGGAAAGVGLRAVVGGGDSEEFHGHDD